jgi:polysaccharide biosynthesis transport protein
MQPIHDPRDHVDFTAYFSVLKRRWLPTSLVLASVFGLSATATFIQKPIYESEGKLLFDKKDKASSLTGLLGQANELSSLTQAGNPLDTEAELVRSVPAAKNAIATLGLKDEKGKALKVDAFLKRLKVKSIRGTDVMAVSYQSVNPDEAAKVVDFLMQHYIESNIRSNRAGATAAREFISKQLPEVESRVQASEAALRQFKEQNRVVALEEESKNAVAQLGNISEQIVQAQSQLADTSSRAVALQGKLGLDAAAGVELSSLSQSKSVQTSLEEYQKVQDELAVKRTRYQDEHPEIVALVAKEAALQQQLSLRVGQAAPGTSAAEGQNLQFSQMKQQITADLVKVESERQGLQNRVAVLSNAATVYQQRMSVLPQLEQTQRQLERRLQVARSTYEELLKRLQDIQVAENQNVGNARVVADAEIPEIPISPRILLNLLLGGTMGVLLAIATVLLLEARDKSIKTVDEAKQLLGLPILGTIPQLGRKGKESTAAPVSELPARDNPHSAASAAYEMLQATLGFTTTDKPLKVVTISSAVPTEGKSFVSANLGVAMAQVGKRVLLIDADMRRPRQQNIWQLPNFQGLSDVLVGQADYRKAATEVLINLDVLTAGTIPPNPGALLESQRIAALIAEVSDDYDLVIIDTPPLTVAADGLMLGKLADGMVLVVRPGTVDSNALNFAKNRIIQAGQTMLGMVVNGVIATNESAYSHHYHYQHYYGKSTTPSIEANSTSKRKLRIPINLNLF